MTSLRILVVEDEEGKRASISEALLSVSGVSSDGIDFVVDGHTARKHLAKVQYDLMVLDVIIPNRVDQPPAPEHGIHLLEDLDRRGNLRMPSHIVGLTAYPDAFTIAVERFSSRLLTLVEFDSLSDDWARRLQARLKHIIAAKEDGKVAISTFGCEIGIVCALHAPELRSVLSNGWAWEQEHVPHDPAIYWRARFLRRGESLLAYATAAAQIGIAAAAVAAMNLMQAFRPSIIAMVGLTAGVRGQVNLGDIIVADPSWDWGSGKVVEKAGGSGFLAAPRQLALAPHLRAKAQLMSADAPALALIRSSWPGDAPPTPLDMHIGPLASGASVVADGETVARIREQHRKLLGLEMEGYGVFCAAESFVGPRPHAIVMKAVVDFADGEKDDRYQHYGSFVSAQALRLFIEGYA